MVADNQQAVADVTEAYDRPRELWLMPTLASVTFISSVGIFAMGPFLSVIANAFDTSVALLGQVLAVSALLCQRLRRPRVETGTIMCWKRDTRQWLPRQENSFRCFCRLLVVNASQEAISRHARRNEFRRTGRTYAASAGHIPESIGQKIRR
jgi:hypothetical protein